MSTKKTTKNEELQTDDEALRDVGLTEGTKKLPGLKLDLRPLTALTLSWMQRNNLFDEGDMVQKTAAYAFLHSADRSDIRAVVNDRSKFLNAVDDWMEEHVKHHAQLEPIADEMNKALQQYMAALSSGGSPYKGDGSKN
jgi:small-conductance mechanosensitive channel